jgi:arylsulfatase A-like enzyme
VVIVIDQFRGDYLERYRDQFSEGGFRLFLDHGAYFTDCNYDYANTHTAPGHATLFSGSYSSGHGIIANEWWDPQKKRMVTSVQDDATKLVGISSNGPGASPHNLLSSTLGDELKLATQGKARVFGIALKDRAAILPAGFAADGAYWIDPGSGAWITSNYYRSDLPAWLKASNEANHAGKYLNREWKDRNGNVLRSTGAQKGRDGSNAGFYEVVGSTPFANDYEFDLARELVTQERLGSGPATDLLAISLSANDILGHRVGPDSPEMQAMVLATDRQLADFFAFLGHQIGLANIWIALSADHGVAPVPSQAAKLHLPAANLDIEKTRAQVNAALNQKFSPGRHDEYLKIFSYPMAWLNDEAFAAGKVREEDAERATGEALKQAGMRGYFTRVQLAQGSVPDTEMGQKYLHSYSPHGGWFVMVVPAPFTVSGTSPADHLSPYTYDTHVPLAFYGLAFQTGTYRRHVEPIDLAVTLSSLLGINAPTHATGRVLTEAIPVTRPEASGRPFSPHVTEPPQSPVEKVQPAGLSPAQGAAR